MVEVRLCGVGVWLWGYCQCGGGMWYVPMWRGMWFCASEAGCNGCAFWLGFGGLVMIISNKGVDSRIIMV